MRWDKITSRNGRGDSMHCAEDTAGMAVTVVDDEPLALDVLVRAARSWNYECQSAPNAEEALELIHRLFDGERITHEGRHLRTKEAFLHSRPERRPPLWRRR